jgi:hypothetical protein
MWHELDAAIRGSGKRGGKQDEGKNRWKAHCRET